MSNKNNSQVKLSQDRRVQTKYYDWKDIANSYYEKSLSLAVLLILFTFLVSPKIEVKPYEAKVVVTETVEIPPEIRERIEPPKEMVRPVVDIVIDDDLSGDDEELEIVATIDPTTLDPYEEVIAPVSKHGQTPKFVVYEEAPQQIRRVPPVYPAAARRAGIEGTVLLQVEVLNDGSIGAIEVLRSVLSGPDGLDEAAIKAVRQWEFTPALSGNQPVAVWVNIPIEFKLN